ncbi:MAG TPA: DUF2269 family protein [Gaiellales bacterium]|nr:DUF2269 family protein [Gaiellales bacterium]
MDAYHTALSLHLLSLLVLAGGIIAFGLSFWRLRSAQSGDEAAPWVRLIERAGWSFPVSILGLVATGAYLTAHSWTWTTAWIDVSIAGLIVVTLQGPLLGGPRTTALAQAVDANGPGELGERPLRLARDPVLWLVLLANPGVVLAIVWCMTAKPGALAAVAAIILGYAAGAVAAFAVTRSPAPRTDEARG